VSQVERYGRRAPGSAIGLRLNPGAGVGYHEGLAYSGERPTKFGIGPDRLADALEAARGHRLTIDTIHFHAGSGWLADGLDRFERALERVAVTTRELIAAGHPIGEVNVGGGLGRPARDDEPPIDLAAYADALARHLGPLGVTVACEPGDWIAKDAGILLAEVVTVEQRGETVFVGLDMGWNVDNAFFIYRFAQELVLCRDALAGRTETVTVAGNINEAGDVFAVDYQMPQVEEGDVVALLNGGGYHQAMASTHCLRPVPKAVFLER
jgi:diaminopimelate decarboxylase